MSDRYNEGRRLAELKHAAGSATAALRGLEVAPRLRLLAELRKWAEISPTALPNFTDTVLRTLAELEKQ